MIFRGIYQENRKLFVQDFPEFDSKVPFEIPLKYAPKISLVILPKITPGVSSGIPPKIPSDQEFYQRFLQGSYI